MPLVVSGERFEYDFVRIYFFDLASRNKTTILTTRLALSIAATVVIDWFHNVLNCTASKTMEKKR